MSKRRPAERALRLSGAREHNLRDVTVELPLGRLVQPAFARLIAPFTPHLAEEAWARIGGEGLAVHAPWPEFDPTLTQDTVKILPVQVNGKRRGEISAPAGAEPADVEKIVLDDPEIARRLEGLTIRKVIVVKDRIVNIVAG